MFEAQLIYSETGPASTAIYSDWFPRRADNAWFTLEIVETSAATNGAFVVVFAYTKNVEDQGDGTQLPLPRILVQPTGPPTPPSDAFTPFSPGLYSVGFGPDWNAGHGFLELVRYGVGFGSLSGSREWVLLRMLQPSWFDSLTA